MSQKSDPLEPPPTPLGDAASRPAVVVEAIYQDGVFKPVRPVNIPAGTPVRVSVGESGGPGAAATADAPRLVTSAERPAPFRLPLLIGLGLAVVLILGLIALRSRTKTAPGASNDPAAASGQTGEFRKVKEAPMAPGEQLAPPELVREIKLPAAPQGKPPIGVARDVAVDSAGNIYVASSSEGIIRKYDSGGNLVTSFGNNTASGDEEPPFGDLHSIAIGNNDTIYALDIVKSRILRYDTKGNAQGEFASRLGYAPHGLSLAPNGDMVIAITGSNAVMRLNSKGETISSIAKLGQGPAEFDDPSDVVSNEKGELFVFDNKNQRIQHLSPDRKLLNEWATESIAAHDGGRLALDKEGHLFVSGPLNQQILVYNQQGEQLAAWSQADVGAPTGLAVDNQGNLYVAYPHVNVVRKYRYK